MPSLFPIPIKALCALVLLGVLSGCAAFPSRPPPLTLEQVVTLAKGGTSSEDIIKQLRESRTVLALSGSQYAKLQQDGVPDDVLDYIQRTYVTAVEFDARARYQSMYWGWGPMYPYPYRPFWSPYPYHW